MDTTAHRIIKRARDTLVDGLQLGWHEAIDQSYAHNKHGVTDTQLDALRRIEGDLWALLTDDPQPPECQACATPLDQSVYTGRPRRYCSDACRQMAHRDRQP